MAIINISVPNQYADELGYQPMVVNPDYVAEVVNQNTLEIISPAIGEPIISNPESRAQFLKRIVPRIIADKLADRAVRILEKTKRDETVVESELLRATIEAAITTT